MGLLGENGGVYVGADKCGVARDKGGVARG